MVDKVKKHEGDFVHVRRSTFISIITYPFALYFAFSFIKIVDVAGENFLYVVRWYDGGLVILSFLSVAILIGWIPFVVWFFDKFLEGK